MGLIPTIRTTLSRLFRPDEATAPVASMFQLFEQQTPQYPTPAIYPLTVNGYQRNEVIYACINKRAKALAEAPLRVYRDNGTGTPEEIEDHPLRALLKRPNERMSEKAFWRATEIYLNVAGFAAWEYERNRAGDVIALWPMRPDFCSFMRGERKSLDVIRYQPWGLAPVDVPIENVLLIQLFDPIYPLLKALSPSAVALRVTAVDNSSTDLQKLMFERGAVVNGLLSSDQMLTETEATRIRQMWKQQHGGYQNWTDPAVLGNGMKYQQTQMNMRDMQYSDLDERSESRICQAFEVPPILINARVGIKSSTYSNYEQARKAFYEETISAEWDYIEAEVTHQLLAQFDGPDAGNYCDFDTRKVTALQEDRTNKWTRAITAFEKNLVTRDESREEMGLDPVDNAPVFYGDTVQAVRETLTGPDATTGAEIGGQPPQDDVVAQAEQVISDAQMAARQAEEAKARRFFTKRRKEGKSAAASEFRWEWHNAEEAATIAAGGQLPVKAAVMDNGTRFADALKRFDTAMAAPSPDDVSRDSLKAAFANVGEAMASAIRPPVVRIEPTVVNVEPPIINMPAPVVNITQAAQVIPDAPVPVVNVVNELPEPEAKSIVPVVAAQRIVGEEAVVERDRFGRITGTRKTFIYGD